MQQCISLPSFPAAPAATSSLFLPLPLYFCVSLSPRSLLSPQLLSSPAWSPVLPGSSCYPTLSLCCPGLVTILCNPADCVPPGSSVQGILQTRTLEWLAIPFPREIFLTQGPTLISCTGRWILYHWATREATLALRREESSWKTSPFYIKALSAEKPPFPAFTCRGLRTALPRRERQDPVLPVACEFHETPPWQLFNRPDEGSEQHVFSCSYTSTITDCIVPGLKIHFQSFFFFFCSPYFCAPQPSQWLSMDLVLSPHTGRWGNTGLSCEGSEHSGEEGGFCVPVHVLLFCFLSGESGARLSTWEAGTLAGREAGQELKVERGMGCGEEVHLEQDGNSPL